MTPGIRELTSAEEVRGLWPLAQDYFEIVAQGLASFGVAVEAETLTSDMMETVAEVLPPAGRAFAFFCKAGPQGMVFLRRLDKTTFEMKRLYVDPLGRGAGLGRRLICHALDAAAEMGAQKVRLDSITPMATAIALYERAGFRRIEAYDGSSVAKIEGAQEGAVYMEKVL